jgi:DNA-binding NtrC family response regulator
LESKLAVLIRPLCSEASHPVGRVLLVDDEPELRRLLHRTLTRAGFDVVDAENGRVALEAARQERFDVVISDVRMPCMGGMELLERLQLEEPGLPVVLISGSLELTDRRGAVELGAFDFLAKPSQLADVQGVALRAVAAHREYLTSHDELSSCERLLGAAPLRANGS